MPPPAWRRRFSSRIRTVTGSASLPVRSSSADTRYRSGRPGPSGARAPKGSIRDNASISVGSLHSMRASVPRPTAGRPMKAWGDLPERAARGTPRRDRAETEAAIEAAGIDLDPVPPGHHRHGDETHETTTPIRITIPWPARRRRPASSGAGRGRDGARARAEPGRLADPRGRQSRRRPAGNGSRASSRGPADSPSRRPSSRRSS